VLIQCLAEQTRCFQKLDMIFLLLSLLQICKIVLMRDFKFRNVVSSQVERYPFHPRGKCVQGVHDSLGWMMKSFKGIHMIGSRLDPRN
jgi:hypothetical protein